MEKYSDKLKTTGIRKFTLFIGDFIYKFAKKEMPYLKSFNVENNKFKIDFTLK